MKSVLKKQSFDYNLIAATYHESGHIILALNNYFHVSNAVVMIHGENDSNVNFFVYGLHNVEDPELHKLRLMAEMHVMSAGLVAEKMYYKDICGSSRFPMHLRDGSSYDISSISQIIRKNNLAAPGKETLLLKHRIKNDVEQFLMEHWGAVKVISHSLHKKKKLTFDELKYILTRKTEHKEFWKARFRAIKLIHSDKATEASIKAIIAYT